MKSNRILIYAHDTFGMGHISRAIKISKAIMKKNKKSKILIITGTAVLDYVKFPDGVDIIKLPSLRSVRINGKLDYISLSGLDVVSVLKIREKIIYETIKEFKPCILFVDFSPKGVKNELLPSLRYIKKNLKTKVWLTMRDILGDSREFIDKWKRRKYFFILNKYYDKILIFGDEKILDFAKEYKLEKSLIKKIVYMGYLVDKNNAKIKKKNQILICVGGGRDGFNMINKSLKFFKKKVIIVAGPLMPDCLFIKLVNKYPPLVILRSCNKLVDLMKESKYLISMCGYNTFCEIIESRVSALVIPRTYPETEQLIRAKIFKEKGILHYCSLNDDIKKELKKIKQIGKINFNCNGMKNITKLIS